MKRAARIFALTLIVGSKCFCGHSQTTATNQNRSDFDSLVRYLPRSHEPAKKYRESDFVAIVAILTNDLSGRQAVLEMASVLDKSDFEYGIGLNQNSNWICVDVAFDNEHRIVKRAVKLLKADLKLRKYGIIFWPELAKTSLFWGRHPPPGVFN